MVALVALKYEEFRGAVNYQYDRFYPVQIFKSIYDIGGNEENVVNHGDLWRQRQIEKAAPDIICLQSCLQFTTQSSASAKLVVFRSETQYKP